VLSSPPYTGLVCPKCQERTAIVTSDLTDPVLTFECQGCAFEWVSLHPSAVIPIRKPQNDHSDSD